MSQTTDQNFNHFNIAQVSRFPGSSNNGLYSWILVPPYWVEEPEDVRVILRSSHVIPCQADGVPKPTIKWFRGNYSFGLNQHPFQVINVLILDTGVVKLPVQNDRKFEILEDGSLKLKDVEAMDGSNYICEASNGVGTGLGKLIQLHVNS